MPLMPLTDPVRVPCFLIVTRNARNNQKYSEDLQGLLKRFSGKLCTFQHGARFRKQCFMAKRTKITIDTDSLLILRGRSSLRAWCPLCAAQGDMIALENVGVISNLAPSEVEEWLESKEIHRSQAADGGLVICLNSLLKRTQFQDAK